MFHVSVLMKLNASFNNPFEIFPKSLVPLFCASINSTNPLDPLLHIRQALIKHAI